LIGPHQGQPAGFVESGAQPDRRAAPVKKVDPSDQNFMPSSVEALFVAPSTAALKFLSVRLAKALVPPSEFWQRSKR
jgi:hypothetical protein